jgi:hypothetical protein
MKPELEALLKAYDSFQETPGGSLAETLKTAYEAKLAEVAARASLSEERLNEMVMRYPPRWVRANLPPGFPKELGQK